MIYRGLAFSRSYDFDFALRRPPPVSKLDRRYTGILRKRDNLLTGEGGKGVSEGPITYDRKNVWSSINHSILSACSGSFGASHYSVFLSRAHVLTKLFFIFGICSHKLSLHYKINIVQSITINFDYFHSKA
jgi:hypothetical protein